MLSVGDQAHANIAGTARPPDQPDGQARAGDKRGKENPCWTNTRREGLPANYPGPALKMKAAWERSADDFNTVMMWAACCLCSFSFLRDGEITAPSKSAYDKGQQLNFADVAVDNSLRPRILNIRIKASKTDPFRKGVDIFLGLTSNELRPVTAVLTYLARRECCSGSKTEDF